MPSYVAFLRAINLGARRKFPKDEIRASVEGAGFEGVETYINTGNVRLSSPWRSRSRVESALEAAFLANRGFDVPSIVFSTAELARIATDAAELTEPDLARHYIYLLKEPLTAEVIDMIERSARNGHRAVVHGRACHMLLGAGYQQAEVDPLRVAKHLGVATNRNLNVVNTLAQKWC